MNQYSRNFLTFNNSVAMAFLKIANFSNNLHDSYYLMIKSYINISDFVYIIKNTIITYIIVEKYS